MKPGTLSECESVTRNVVGCGWFTSWAEVTVQENRIPERNQPRMLQASRNGSTLISRKRRSCRFPKRKSNRSVEFSKGAVTDYRAHCHWPAQRRESHLALDGARANHFQDRFQHSESSYKIPPRFYIIAVSHRL
jgi:hypothetical protein